MASPLIEVSDLRKIFIRGNESIPALGGVTFAINSGEFVAITGTSGSGKSTLLYILALIDRQTSGTYKFMGTVTDNFVDDERAELRNRRMGFIFQNFHLLPRADALRNVSMPLEYARSHGAGFSAAEIKARSEEALRRVGLGDRLRHQPNELSGGQCQRVAIARALVSNPAVLFADEPTGNLDSRNTAEIMELFSSLNADGKTVLMVTHDGSLAQRAARRIRLLDGRLEREDPHAAA